MTNKKKCPINKINIIQSHGKSALDSVFYPGYVLRLPRVSQQMPTKVENAKIAFLDINLYKFRLAMGTGIKVDDPKNLENLRQKECDVLKDRVQTIIKSGANVIFTTKALDNIAAKYLVEAGIIGVRRIEKPDMRRMAKATGGTVVTTLAQPDGTEYFDPAHLGTCESVYEEAIGDNDHIFVNIGKKAINNVCTIILRGANDMMTEEIERSLHDSLCVLKRTLESGKVVAGGGAVEVALHVFLNNFGKSFESKEQIPIMEFAEAMLVIPKVLACNAAKDAAELISKLTTVHALIQKNPTDEKYAGKGLWHTGLDLVEGKIRNNLEKGVLEPLVSKLKSIRFATEAAITILRIDDMIKLIPNENEEKQQRRR